MSAIPRIVIAAPSSGAGGGGIGGLAYPCRAVCHALPIFRFPNVILGLPPAAE